MIQIPRSDNVLAYLKREINSKERRSVIRYMTQYRTLDAIIESKRMDLFPSHTANWDEKPSQGVRVFSSEAEDYTISSVEIDEYVLVKKKLDLAYGSVKPAQKMIWDENFVEGRSDPDIYNDHKNKITRKVYYREKSELIQVVAECLSINTK